MILKLWLLLFLVVGHRSHNILIELSLPFHLFLHHLMHFVLHGSHISYCISRSLITYGVRVLNVILAGPPLRSHGRSSTQAARMNY